MYVIFTIDCESPDDSIGFEESVIASFQGKEYGVGLICDILEEKGFYGSFFIDTGAEEIFGEDAVVGAVNYIAKRNHDVQLHIHPNGNEFCFLADNEKREMLKKGCEIIGKGSGESPKAFRAGSYMMDEKSIPILRDFGIIADCSNFLSVSPLSITKNRVKIVDGIYEIPVSFYRLILSPFISFFNSVSKRNAFYGGNCKIDINWMNIHGLKRVCKKFLLAGNSLIVVFLHSFSFIKWEMIKNNAPLHSIIREDVIERLKSFVNFLKNEKGVEVVTVKEFLNLISNSEEISKKVLSAADYVPIDFWGIDGKQLVSSLFFR
ncbi:MAG: hypothetical protein D6734_03715 [Candidatus Schekmanbacteria bacterium]|nr:MAG: hypothetical protein D6734_03715 [Candidatus Schekmanbacteria bacterium]